MVCGFKHDPCCSVPSFLSANSAASPAALTVRQTLTLGLPAEARRKSGPLYAGSVNHLRFTAAEHLLEILEFGGIAAKDAMLTQ
jgi:hypothetical protein